MAVVSEPPRAVYASAVETVAAGVVRALRDPGDTFRLADHVAPDDPAAGLAAIRILGADALLPFTLGAHPFEPRDAELATTGFRLLPAADAHDGSVRALRDHAAAQVATELGITNLQVETPTPPESVSPTSSWQTWCQVLAQLAPLATPGLAGPVQDMAATRLRDTARGLTRAILRRDWLASARLARWLALTSPAGDPPFAVVPVLRHVELFGDADPRTSLELCVARHGWSSR